MILVPIGIVIYFLLNSLLKATNKLGLLTSGHGLWAFHNSSNVNEITCRNEGSLYTEGE